MISNNKNNQSVENPRTSRLVAAWRKAKKNNNLDELRNMILDEISNEFTGDAVKEEFDVPNVDLIGYFCDTTTTKTGITFLHFKAHECSEKAAQSQPLLAS